MKQRMMALIFVLTLALVPLTAQASNGNSCWGQATAVFAQTGQMGKHASQETTPRMGLHNLAVALYEAGVISDDSMAALGAFVADAMGLSIDACMD